jgi:hypothetical protein
MEYLVKPILPQPSNHKMKIASTEAQNAIKAGTNIRLNLGAGNAPRPGFLSVDHCSGSSIDIVADLNSGLPLIPDRSVTEIYSRHTFEHIENLEYLLIDLARVCTNDARITIIVPHFSNTNAYSDPTHKRFFGIYSFSYYSRKPYFKRCNTLPKYLPKLNFKTDRIYLRFYQSTLADRIASYLLERMINKHPSAMEFYERRLSFLWPAWEIEFQLTLE